MKKNMKEPTIMEIADEVGLSKEEITYAMDAIQTPMSLYELSIPTAAIPFMSWTRSAIRKTGRKTGLSSFP